MSLDLFQSRRQLIDTGYGPIAVSDVGAGPAAIFVHGVFMSGALWRNVVTDLSALRRCISIDMPAHGQTVTTEEHDLSLTGQARALTAVCDALGLAEVDVVGNDTGGAVCQVFVAADPSRVRSLALTNCDAHDNLPPEAFAAAVEMAAAGDLAPYMQALAADHDLARSDMGFGLGFERPGEMSDELIDEYLQCAATPARAVEVERLVRSTEPSALLAAEEVLRTLEVPTLLVWGTGDLFFEISWAYWLKDLIPSAREVIEVPGGKLFFPDERPEDLVPHLRSFWST